MSVRACIHALVLLVCGLGVLAPAARAQECGEQQQQSLDVLSWNIYMRPAALFWNGQLKRARHIGEILKDSDHDVLFFQEAFGRKSRKILRKALDGAYPYEVQPVGDGRTLNSGLWVLSRIPIDTVDAVTFAARMGTDRGAAKGAVLVQLSQGVRTTQLVNTHLQANRGPRQQAVREQQYRQIVGLLEAHARPEVCQVVAGDLNTDEQDVEAYEAMLDVLKARNGALRRCERALRADMPMSTWGGPWNTLVRKRSRGDIKLLDHALVRDTGRREHPLKLSVERVLHLFTAPWSRKHEHLSDHHPISIRLVEDGIAPGSRIHNAFSIDGRMKLVVTLDGGSIDISGLDPEDRQKVVVKELPKEEWSELRVLGDPARDELVLSFAVREAGAVELRAIDGLGRLVMDRTQAVAVGENRMVLPIHGLRQGAYILELSLGTERRVVRFVKD